jgi:hypothetical protein
LFSEKDTKDKKQHGQKSQSSKQIVQPQNNPPKQIQPPKPQIKQQEIHDKTGTSLSCGCLRPHETFPGIDHYLNINNKK